MTREEAIEVYNGLINEKIKEAFEFFAPELAESKDERIRKGLIEALKTSKTVGELKFILPEPTREEAIVYLEKQKEQEWNKKPCLTCQEYNEGFEAGRLEGVTAGYNKAMKEMLQKEQKPAEYLNKDMIYAIMNKLHDLSFSQLIPIDSDEFEKINEITGDVHKLLDYLIEQKPAEWSEEDEKMLNDCIMALSNWRDAVANYGHEVAPCQKLIDWLKALRPSWKPSEEQMKALKYAAYHMLPGEEYRDVLFSLFKDLKKLM